MLALTLVTKISSLGLGFAHPPGGGATFRMHKAQCHQLTVPGRCLNGSQNSIHGPAEMTCFDSHRETETPGRIRCSWGDAGNLFVISFSSCSIAARHHSKSVRFSPAFDHCLSSRVDEWVAWPDLTLPKVSLGMRP